MQRTFYLGANTPEGFFSYYGELDRAAPSRKLIIKGGPGTGKSSLMRKAAEVWEGAGESVEYIVCSSDPDSLDAAIARDRGTALVDGTAPHVVEPVCPGAYDEIINLGSFWNQKRLRGARSDIEALSGRIGECYKSAYRFLRAARTAQTDIRATVCAGTDTKRAERLAERIAKKEFKKKDAAKPGTVSRRFISGITPLGIKHYINEDLEGFGRVYVLYDPFKTGGSILSALCRAAADAGYDVTCCYCPMSPGGFPEHLIIEELSLAFVSENAFHAYGGEPVRRVNLERYVSEELRRKNRQKIRFDMSLCRALTGRAVEYIKEAKSLHDELETIYTGAMDFKKLGAFRTKLLADLKV